jgi:Icc-related predicted phosphoesterase
MIRIVATSDTHAKHRALDVPAGEILVHAGDLTSMGSLEDVVEFNDWLGSLPHPHKIVIAGNHDFCFERDREASEPLLTNCIYLHDSAATVLGIRFWGSPWQPWFFNWAFNLERGDEIRRKWDLIPDNTDVLITHGPPFGHGDRTRSGELVGCQDLLEVVERIRPRLHVYGHIHEGYGLSSNDYTTMVNASSCDSSYDPVNPPVVFEYDPRWNAERSGGGIKA